MASAHTCNRDCIQPCGMKAVILYPALTTPALVDEEGVLKVIIALDTPSFTSLDKEKLSDKPLAPQTPLALFEILKFHANLLLVPWGNGHCERFRPCQGEKACTLFYNSINCFSFTLFGDQKSCTNAFHRVQSSPDGKDPLVRGVYLGELPEKGGLVSVEMDGERIPFGVIAAPAAKMYREAKYQHLFYLEFKNFLALGNADRNNGTMKELVWICMPNPPEHPYHQYENPSDTVITENFAKNINPFDPLKAPVPFLEKNVDTMPQTILKAMDCKPETLDLFRLRSSGKKKKEDDKALEDELSKLKAPSGTPLAELPWLTQKGGWLLYSRHPVFLKNKVTKFAAMTDLHLSSRQMLYKMVKPQVIPGADEEDSPHIGNMAHDNFSSVRDLMSTLCQKADALLIGGDIYDHRQNLDPKACLEDEKLTNTASLWDLLDYRSYRKKNDEPRYYPKHIDGLMMLELILGQYAGAKPRPVFLVSGNHEGYRIPYGISPRLGKEWIKLNEGIPADHNLSIYEAVLIYGPNYHRFHTVKNFQHEAMGWIYQVFSPWSDFCISNKDVNLVGLGWGKDEVVIEVVLRNLTKVGLPVAGDAINKSQQELVKYAAGQADTKKNIILSHFTHINYNTPIPFIEGGKAHQKDITITMNVAAEDASNTGSFKDFQQEMADLREQNKIHYSISGHSHRAGAYLFEGSKKTVGKALHRAIRTKPFFPSEEPDSAKLPTSGILPKDKSTALVCGSAGPMCDQNMAGEFKGYGMDSPQGLILDVENGKVDFERWESGGEIITKPRFSVLMANLCHFKKIKPFERVKLRKKIRLDIPRSQYSSHDKSLTPYHTYKVYTYDIRIQLDEKGAAGQIDAKVDPEMKKVFQDWPVQRVKVVGIKIDEPDQNIGLDISIDQKKQHHLVSDGMLKIFNEGEKPEGYIFFASVFFGSVGDNTGRLIQTYYETTTPWCMPVVLKREPDLNSYMLLFDYRELPDFKFMALRFPEFRGEEAPMKTPMERPREK